MKEIKRLNFKLSWVSAMLKVTKDIILALDKGDVAVMVSLDLIAAFGTVDHETLWWKRGVTYGVNGAVLHWVSSYPENRRQWVGCSISTTPPTRVACGFPQGSVLGPILFCSTSPTWWASPNGSDFRLTFTQSTLRSKGVDHRRSFYYSRNGLLCA